LEAATKNIERLSESGAGRARGTAGSSLLIWTVKGACILAAILYLVLTVNLHQVLPALLQARWALAAIFLFHFLQLAFSSAAWQMQFPGRRLWWTCSRIRWIREGAGSLLPIGALGAAALGSKLLCRYGISGASATASLAADLAAETTGQLLFLIAGVALIPTGRMSGHGELWLATLLLCFAGICVTVVLAQRMGLSRLIDLVASRLGARWRKSAVEATQRFHDALMILHARRERLGKAVMLHSTSWGLGAVEVWIAFHALDHAISWRAAFVVESIGMAARSAGFAIPGALGVQETGFAFAGGLFGISPELAIACSFLTRGRELLVAATSLVLWGREELRVRDYRVVKLTGEAG
jgi:putative membrane protein